MVNLSQNNRFVLLLISFSVFFFPSCGGQLKLQEGQEKVISSKKKPGWVFQIGDDFVVGFSEKFETESLVVTSGSEEVFPPNLLIGKVASISQDERQPFQQAEIEPLVDSANLQTVFLIL